MSKFNSTFSHFRYALQLDELQQDESKYRQMSIFGGIMTYGNFR